MTPLKYILTLEQLEDLASRSNFRYGKAMAKDAEITPVESNTFNMIATIKHGTHQKRTVILESTPKGLRWKCTCSSKKNFFCQHCTAVGLWLVSQGES